MVNEQEDFDRFMAAISYIEDIDQSGALDSQTSQTSQEQGEQSQQRILRSRANLKSRSMNNESMDCSTNLHNDFTDNSISNTKRQRKRKNVNRNDSIDKENAPVPIRIQPKRLKKSATVLGDSQVANTDSPVEKLQSRLNKLTSLETEVANILVNDLHNQQQQVEVPRRSHVEMIHHNVSLNELDQNVSPIMKAVDEKMDQTPRSPDFEKSPEISLIIYKKKEDIPEKELLVSELSPSTSLTRTPCEEILKKNPFNISLNMSCHSDTSYDLAEHSPFRDLEEELDENNNLVMSHPKLNSFVVTSDLNFKFGLDSEKIHTPASRAVLNELNILNENGLMNFKRALSSRSSESCKDNFNWKLFKNILTDSGESADSLALVGVKAADINMENFTSPLLVIEQEAEALEKLEKEKETARLKRQKERASKPEETVKVEEVKILKKSSRASSNPETKDLEFVFAKCQEIFTPDELSSGIFCDVNKNGKIINRSKVRTALCEEKVYRLKEELGKRLKISGKLLENAWYYLRADLNKLLYSQFKSKIKKEKH